MSLLQYIDIPDNISMTDVHPFLKCPGGKTQILDLLDRRLPPTFNDYYEPFLGGGALFFHLFREGKIKGTAYLSDANKSYIQVYKAVKNSPKELMDTLDQPPFNDWSEEAYYHVRDLFNSRPLDEPVTTHAAYVIFLNKLCVNGLWRVNKKGGFNVSYRKTPPKRLYYRANIMASSYALKNAIVRHMDFEKAIRDAMKGDFVYFDPPYWSTYSQYTEDWIPSRDLSRIIGVSYRLHNRSVKWMHSNVDHPDIHHLFDTKNTKMKWNVDSIVTKCNINRDGDNRKMTEVIIRNYR